MSLELLEQRLQEVDELQGAGGWHGDGEMIPTLYGLLTGDLALAPFVGLDGVWKIPARPGQQLMLLAGFIAHTGGHSPTEPLGGLVFATEAWMVTGKLENSEQVQRCAERRELHRHPERVETRITVGVLSDLSALAAVHPRSGEFEILGDSSEGEVLDGLRELMAACGGVND